MAAPSPKALSRESDERILQMVRLRASGWSGSQIGAVFGIGKRSALQRAGKVAAADIEESGEPEARDAYWPEAGP